MACNFSTSELQKDPQFFNMLTWTSASRHSGVQFFDIRTWKCAPSMWCFVHFDFEMCFPLQRRAISRYRKYKKCFGADVFCTVWLQNAFFAIAACNFWFLCWAPSSAPAALTGLLVDWPDTRIIERTQRFATSLTFGADVSSLFWLSRYCSYFLLTFALLHLLSADLTTLLCFSTVHIVGSLLFKLPSINTLGSNTFSLASSWPFVFTQLGSPRIVQKINFISFWAKGLGPVVVWIFIFRSRGWVQGFIW